MTAPRRSRKSGTVAKALEVPHAFADVQLDGELQQDAILKKLDELERIARRNGSAIGVAAAFDESVDAISKWSEEAAMRGIEIVAVPALAERPQTSLSQLEDNHEQEPSTRQS